MLNSIQNKIAMYIAIILLTNDLGKLFREKVYQTLQKALLLSYKKEVMFGAKPRGICQ